MLIAVISSNRLTEVHGSSLQLIPLIVNKSRVKYYQQLMEVIMKYVLKKNKTET